MNSIIWQKPDGSFASTSITNPETNSNDHAAYLKTVGAVPADWVVSAVDTAIPPKPLSEVRAAKLASLESSRDAAERANVTVAGKVYSASEAFQAKVSRTINQTGRGKPLAGANDAWRTADAQPVVMTAVLLGLIEDAITAQSAAAWTRFGLRFDAVQAATTNEAVDAVVW